MVYKFVAPKPTTTEALACAIERDPGPLLRTLPLKESQRRPPSGGLRRTAAENKATRRVGACDETLDRILAPIEGSYRREQIPRKAEEKGG